jgi:hypothetical protein
MPAKSRLIVLVPDGRINEDSLIAALADLAVPPVGEIRFVGLTCDTPDRRVAIQLESLEQKAQRLPVAVCKQLIDVGSWLKAVQVIAQPGDQIVCQIEQRTGSLGEELRETTSFPVHMLDGLRPTILSHIRRALGRLAFEIFPLVVVAGFFWLQVNLEAQLDGLLSNLAISLTILAELGLIFLWSLFIR